MEKTEAGTSVGVADPYEHVDRCDHLTDDGQCRFAVEQADQDRSFARDRRRSDYACPVVDPDGDWDWHDCPHFRSREHQRSCVRCGLTEVRLGTEDTQPLLEEHHLSYADAEAGELAHEITVSLCRWCHARVHNSWASISDDVNPPTEALAAKEQRRSKEAKELEFRSAAERVDE